jgi:hypothetical protein
MKPHILELGRRFRAIRMKPEVNEAAAYHQRIAARFYKDARQASAVELYTLCMEEASFNAALARAIMGMED